MNNNESSTQIQTSLIYRFRELWRRYILYTREYIINVACGFETPPFITHRMTQNALDFFYEFRQYYEYEKSRIFELLLKKQFFISASLLNSANAGDTELTEIFKTEWYNNVDEIAGFLASVNPNWSKEAWQKILYDYLFLLEYEGTCEYMAKYNAELKSYETIQDQSFIIGNYMADGIINQFFK
ncbi:MAG: hypothetical protein ACYCWE_20850 [Eubacteriales bacterium]